MASFSLHLSHTLGSFSLRPIKASSNGVPFSKPKSGGPTILELPLEKIRRPLMRTRANDPAKVKDLMESIQQIGLQEPVFLDVTALRLISALVSQLFDVKSDVGQKRLYGGLLDQLKHVKRNGGQNLAKEDLVVEEIGPQCSCKDPQGGRKVPSTCHQVLQDHERLSNGLPIHHENRHLLVNRVQLEENLAFVAEVLFNVLTDHAF
ncbi:uncharacterized protein [Elaeis guineensis]|uniref:uncharacterized protein isoform X1 n=1 Tax=Elaeis guineensis var. tenera TaxID=51953 RepID=UPI003C6CFEE1